jgi:Uncharacterised nucleotidyltransferase
MSAQHDSVVDQQADQRAGPPVTGASGAVRSGPINRATSEILVALLRASLGKGTVPDAAGLAECDWAGLARLAAHHGLVPILYRVLAGQGTRVPAEWLRSFKLQYLATVLHNRLAGTCLDAIGAAFHGGRISVIVMKGVALLRTLYDDPGLRVMGDIDLLVDDRDVQRAGAELQRIGLRPLGSEHADQRGPLCHIHLIYCGSKPQSIPVELHWRLFEPYQPYVFDLAAVRAEARPFPGLPPNVFVMAPEHELAHLCVHLDRHAITYRSLLGRKDWFERVLLPQGLGRLIWLYDIARYLERQNATLDWDRFVDTARRWAIDGRVHATFELSRRLLDVGPPPEVLRALAGGRPRFVERIAHRVVLASQHANENRGSGPAGARRARRLTGLSAHVLRFAHTWISVFPPNAYLRARYATPARPLRLRGRHLREVLPGLWAETRERLRPAVAPARDGAPR